MCELATVHMANGEQEVWFLGSLWKGPLEVYRFRERQAVQDRMHAVDKNLLYSLLFPSTQSLQDLVLDSERK